MGALYKGFWITAILSIPAIYVVTQLALGDLNATVGGAAATSELAPGARVPTLAHTVGRLRPSVVRELGLKRHGLSLVGPEVRAFAPALDGEPVVLWSDVARTAAGLRAHSALDADRYAGFDRLVRSLGSFMTESAMLYTYVCCDSGKIAIVCAVTLAEHKRHKRGAAGNDSHSELSRHIISEGSRPDLRDR